MWENEVRKVLKVLNVIKIRKRFNEQEKMRKCVREVVNVRKICRRCTESEISWGELYWMSEFFERDILNVKKL